MKRICNTKCFGLLFIIAIAFHTNVFAQSDTNSKYGLYDTIFTQAIFYEGEWVSFKQLDEVIICNCSERKKNKLIEEWTRLRNAVYVTYPYAKKASAILNDIYSHLETIDNKAERKKYIKSRENELKTEFADKITNLSVYQGKVLMKLIYRETDNTCFEIIKEMRGGFTARFWQTIAFFFGSNLKQNYDPSTGQDRQIEQIVQEVKRAYGWSS